MEAGEVVAGLWRFEALHPAWTEAEDWQPSVAWWVVAAPSGAVLVDPLVTDWDELDALVARLGGCAAVVRTIHWHERSVAEACARYGAPVVAKESGELPDGWRAIDVERADEIALWLPVQHALLFGDAMIRRPAGGALRMCPESWTQPPGGRPRLRQILSGLLDLPVEHVLVAHGPLVLGDGAVSLRSALA